MEDWFQGPLFDAIAKGDEASVLHLLSLGASVNKTDNKGLTALHWCSSSAEGELLVPMLINRKAKIDAKDKLGRTPLHLHCVRGRTFGTVCLLHHVRIKPMYHAQK